MAVRAIDELHEWLALKALCARTRKRIKLRPQAGPALA
jgi:hypothetical protein